MKKIILFSVIIVIIITISAAWTYRTDDQAEIDAIKKVIVESYVEGLFLKGDAEMIKKGWHNECDIVYLNKGKLGKLPAKYWADRMTKNPAPLDPNVTYKFTDVKVTGTAGIAIVEIYTSGQHLYTDYMCMYKFSDGWKICTKIYEAYPVNRGK